jgi:hypothetical protein
MRQKLRQWEWEVLGEVKDVNRNKSVTGVTVKIW